MVTSTRKFSTSSSVLLDVLRFASAIIIAFAHSTQSFFSTGADETDYGRPALVMLFLLSGFVIRYVTVVRRGRLIDFGVDRVSRIYSVVLPALAFTIIASYLACWINPAFYHANWGDMNRPFFRTAMNLTFMAQSWNLTIAPFCNSPFWTLSYEVFYYGFYAFGLYFCGGKRLFWLVILAVLAGQHILLLLPLWLIGCVGHDAYQRIRTLNISSLRLNVGFAILAIAGYWALRGTFQALFYLRGFATTFCMAHHIRPLNLHWAVIYYRQGLPIMFLLLWAMVLLDRIHLNEKSLWVRWIRLLSEGTFPLYLLHFPFFVLVTAFLPRIRDNSMLRFAMLVSVILISLLLAHPTVAFKNLLRDLLHKYVKPEPIKHVNRVPSTSIAAS